MATEHANKGGRRYRYYVSRPPADRAERAWRIPAGDLDAIVSASVLRLLRDPQRVAAELGTAGVAAQSIIERCASLAAQAEQTSKLSSLLEQLAARVQLTPDRVALLLDRGSLAALVGVDTAPAPDDHIELDHPVALKRRGHELRLIYAVPDARPPQRDDRLIQLLASGRAAYDELQSNIVDTSPTRRSHLVRIARLCFLAPDIVTAILDGRQPVNLTSRALMRPRELPIDWSQQRQLLGFA